MSLPEFSIRRPVTILMCTLICILLGGIAYVRLPVDLMPDMVYPTISVRADYPGVAPEEMENLVARPLEEAFAAAPGVEEITSSSSEGTTSVRVSFAYGTNLDEAANELRIRLDRRRNVLPEDMEPPVMYKFDVSQYPIMFLTGQRHGSAHATPLYRKADSISPGARPRRRPIHHSRRLAPRDSRRLEPGEASRAQSFGRRGGAHGAPGEPQSSGGPGARRPLRSSAPHARRVPESRSDS